MVFGLAVVAMLAGMPSPEAIAQFGRLWGSRLAHLWGFKSGKTQNETALYSLEVILSLWQKSKCMATGECMHRNPRGCP